MVSKSHDSQGWSPYFSLHKGELNKPPDEQTKEGLLRNIQPSYNEQLNGDRRNETSQVTLIGHSQNVEDHFDTTKEFNNILDDLFVTNNEDYKKRRAKRQIQQKENYY